MTLSRLFNFSGVTMRQLASSGVAQKFQCHNRIDIVRQRNKIHRTAVMSAIDEDQSFKPCFRSGGQTG
jgi:hypothetical protein